MIWALFRRILLALCLAGYAFAALRPFVFKSPVAFNHVQPMAGGATGVSFATAGILRSKAPPTWMPAAIETGQLTVQLRVRPRSDHQDGPARIFTISKDPFQRNLTIGQEGNALELRLRTSPRSPNGTPALRIAGAFAAGQWTDIEVDVAPGRVLVEVGRDVRQVRVVPAAPLAAWDRSFELALGNELTHDRPWLGDIQSALVLVGDQSVDYAAPGALERPRFLWHLHRTPKLLPTTDVDGDDAIINLLGFIPFGLLLGLTAGSPWLLFKSLVAIATVSSGLEVAQFLIPGRYPSIMDVILNCVGGAMGLVLTRRLALRAARRVREVGSTGAPG